MLISVIQSKPRFEYDLSNLKDFDLEKCRLMTNPMIEEGFDMIEQAAAEGSKLIVTIEAFNSPLSVFDKRYSFLEFAEPMDGPMMKRFSKISEQYRCYIVAGIYTNRDNKVYNSAVLFGPEGKIVGIFDKVHLPAGEEWHVTPGDRYPVFETEYGNIGMLVCWDMQFPEAARELALGGADIIALPTWGWENIYGLCRAYENSVYIADAMGTPYREGGLWEGNDPSCIVDNMGKILASGGRNCSQIVTAEVNLKTEPLPQYNAGGITGLSSMRQIRTMQRRPDTYNRIALNKPQIMKRYE